MYIKGLKHARFSFPFYYFVFNNMNDNHVYCQFKPVYIRGLSSEKNKIKTFSVAYFVEVIRKGIVLYDYQAMCFLNF